MVNDNMTFEILLSCMNQNDFSLMDKSNICTDVVMINQCGRDDIAEETKGNSRRKMVYSSQRGLSRSRNRALEEATGDVVLFADDDETFVDNVDKIVLDAFRDTNADIIAFELYGYEKRLKKEPYRLRLFDTLKISSCQVACRRKSIIERKLQFDVNLGAGTANGAGEENKFLWDAHKAGLRIFYYPVYIAHLSTQKSTWFAGFDKEYFLNRGKVTGYFMGKKWAIVYALYFIFTKYRLYKKDCAFREALGSILKGIYSEKNFTDS